MAQHQLDAAALHSKMEAAAIAPRPLIGNASVKSNNASVKSNNSASKANSLDSASPSIFSRKSGASSADTSNPSSEPRGSGSITPSPSQSLRGVIVVPRSDIDVLTTGEEGIASKSQGIDVPGNAVVPAVQTPPDVPTASVTPDLESVTSQQVQAPAVDFFSLFDPPNTAGVYSPANPRPALRRKPSYEHIRASMTAAPASLPEPASRRKAPARTPRPPGSHRSSHGSTRTVKSTCSSPPTPTPKPVTRPRVKPKKSFGDKLSAFICSSANPPTSEDEAEYEKPNTRSPYQPKRPSMGRLGHPVHTSRSRKDASSSRTSTRSATQSSPSRGTSSSTRSRETSSSSRSHRTHSSTRSGDPSPSSRLRKTSSASRPHQAYSATRVGKGSSSSRAREKSLSSHRHRPHSSTRPREPSSSSRSRNTSGSSHSHQTLTLIRSWGTCSASHRAHSSIRESGSSTSSHSRNVPSSSRSHRAHSSIRQSGRSPSPRSRHMSSASGPNRAQPSARERVTSSSSRPRGDASFSRLHGSSSGTRDTSYYRSHNSQPSRSQHTHTSSRSKKISSPSRSKPQNFDHTLDESHELQAEAETVKSEQRVKSAKTGLHVDGDTRIYIPRYAEQGHSSSTNTKFMRPKSRGPSALVKTQMTRIKPRKKYRDSKDPGPRSGALVAGEDEASIIYVDTARMMEKDGQETVENYVRWSTATSTNKKSSSITAYEEPMRRKSVDSNSSLDSNRSSYSKRSSLSHPSIRRPSPKLRHRSPEKSTQALVPSNNFREHRTHKKRPSSSRRRTPILRQTISEAKEAPQVAFFPPTHRFSYRSPVHPIDLAQEESKERRRLVPCDLTNAVLETAVIVALRAARKEESIYERVMRVMSLGLIESESGRLIKQLHMEARLTGVQNVNSRRKENRTMAGKEVTTKNGKKARKTASERLLDRIKRFDRNMGKNKKKIILIGGKRVDAN